MAPFAFNSPPNRLARTLPSKYRRAMIRLRVLFCILAGVCLSPISFADNVTVKTVKHSSKRSVQVVATNPKPVPVTITVAVSKAKNLRSSPNGLVTTVLASGQSQTLMTLQAAGSGEWTYGYRWGSEPGRNDTPADNVEYALPYPRGAAFEVIQAYDGNFSHHDKHAIDFKMPVGTPVHAAREGVVFHVIDEHGTGGPDPAFKSKTNRILIAHADGTVGRYSHLQRGGVVVSVGQRVRAGQPIATSGNSGYSTTPHLHFAVERPIDGWASHTIPTRWKTASGVAFLVSGQSYRNRTK